MAGATSKRRRWLSYRLRTLLVVFAVVAVPLGLVANERHQSNYERKLADQLKRLGVKEIALDIPYAAANPELQSKSRGWARRLAARILGERIYCVWGQGSDCKDLSQFAHLSRLQLLDLSRSPVEDLSPLAGLATLEVLRLNDTAVSDVTPLARMPKLRVLSLFGAPVTNVAPLAELPKLEELNLYYTPVSDIGPLVALKSLKHLELNKSLVSNADVQAFQRARPDCSIWRFQSAAY